MVFNVIIYNVNTHKMEEYDIFPYFMSVYKNKKKKDRPKTFEEFKKFIESESLYQFWGRCEYEIVLTDWPNGGISEKWDIHKQIMMNIDLITKLFMEYELN
jgi:hypothetical protein